MVLKAASRASEAPSRELVEVEKAERKARKSPVRRLCSCVIRGRASEKITRYDSRGTAALNAETQFEIARARYCSLRWSENRRTHSAKAATSTPATRSLAMLLRSWSTRPAAFDDSFMAARCGGSCNALPPRLTRMITAMISVPQRPIVHEYQNIRKKLPAAWI